jgi:hypothetical protein
MTDNNNFDMPPGQPDDQDPGLEILNEIDEEVARITDADIEDRLHKTLRQVGYSHQPHAGPGMETFPCPHAGEALVGEATSILASSSRELKASLRLLRTQEEARATTRETAAIITAAHEEADRALNEAASIVRAARKQADQIISDAHREAERVRVTHGDSARETGFPVLPGEAAHFEGEDAADALDRMKRRALYLLIQDDSHQHAETASTRAAATATPASTDFHGVRQPVLSCIPVVRHAYH